MNIHLELGPAFVARLPQTAALLRAGGLVVHPWVTQVTLHGSRGLAGHCRPESDIDLSLLIHFRRPPPVGPALGRRLAVVTDWTLSNWQGPVEVDLAVIFPRRPCHLACFGATGYDPDRCAEDGPDCFGVYKVQRGCGGFVLDAGVQVARMYPCVTIWSSRT